MRTWLKTGIAGSIVAILFLIVFSRSFRINEIILLYIASFAIIGSILGYLYSKTKETKNKIIKAILVVVAIILIISVVLFFWVLLSIRGLSSQGFG